MSNLFIARLRKQVNLVHNDFYVAIGSNKVQKQTLKEVQEAVVEVSSHVEEEHHASFVGGVDHVVRVGVVEEDISSFLPGVLAVVHHDVAFLLFFGDQQTQVVPQHALVML